eukprot:7007392-Prymnesium_polylepis.1
MRAGLPLALCASRTGRATWGRCTRSAPAEQSHRLKAAPSHCSWGCERRPFCISPPMPARRGCRRSACRRSPVR